MKNKMFGKVVIEFDSWTPIVIANKKQHNEEYKGNFMISKVGNICMTDKSGKAIVCRKYWHTRNNRWYVDFHNNGEHINQSIRGLIERSWGKDMANAYTTMFESKIAA